MIFLELGGVEVTMIAAELLLRELGGKVVEEVVISGCEVMDDAMLYAMLGEVENEVLSG